MKFKISRLHTVIAVMNNYNEASDTVRAFARSANAAFRGRVKNSSFDG